MILEKLPDFCRMPEKPASVARRREGSGDTSPDVASVAQIKSRLSPEKAAAGEDLRHITLHQHARHTITPVPIPLRGRGGCRGAA